MAAKRFRSALACALHGHKWESGLPSGHSWCRRCERYDDHPALARNAAIYSFVRHWSPLWIKVGRRETSLRVGTPYHRWLPQLSLRVELNYRWERYTGGPGISVSLHVWRFLAGASIGGLWQDEDGEGRALLRIWTDFQTAGWPYLLCLFGHKWESEPRYSTYVYCSRCEETCEIESPERPVAA